MYNREYKIAILHIFFSIIKQLILDLNALIVRFIWFSFTCQHFCLYFWLHFVRRCMFL